MNGDGYDDFPDFEVKNSKTEFRLDYEPNSDINITFQAGYSWSKTQLVTGIGRYLADGYEYTYYQLRGRYKNWFSQVYLNQGISGDTRGYDLGNRITEKVFSQATAILPICSYLENVVKEHPPKQNSGVFLEGIASTKWKHTEKIQLEHPCVGLVQDANWWGKTKELLVLENVLEKMPDVYFYWAGDGQYREKITEKLEKFQNF